ncbi:hypothetical protein [Leptotrichia hongkongensis]|uniref:hypothetical protein n=1 Tax=Leptotrichia hongkongensis TaxID=554406 RepID=UPI0035A9A75B
MDNNKFGENAKEQLEREIEELKRQKEIQDLQRQKEELEKTVYGSVAGSSTKNINKVEKPIRNINNPEINKQEDEEEEAEEKYVSNKMTTILAAAVAIFIVLVGSGIFYLRSQNKKKKENLKKEMAAVSQNQNIPTVTNAQTSEIVQQQEQKKVEQPKVEEKKEMPKESNEKLIVKSPVGVKKGSYCINPSASESAFDTDTVEDSYAQHGYMADISFQDCVINNGSSLRHTGPVTVTVNLAEEKNYDAVMNRSKWYLENGQIRRVNGSDDTSLYFNGWLMYKQSN